MEHKIHANEAKQRFDRFCRKFFRPHEEISLGEIYARIRNGVLTVNNETKDENYRLQEGDIIHRKQNETPYDFSVKPVNTKSEQANSSKPSQDTRERLLTVANIKQHIIFEDENWLVFNKPADMVMHPTDHHQGITIHEIMQTYLKETDGSVWTKTFSPQFCYRLDKDTSGVLIAAKNYKALQHLNQAIRQRKVKKEYIAVVAGHLKEPQTIDAPLFEGFDKKLGKGKTFVNKEKGKKATTTIIPEQHTTHHELGPITLIRIAIKTGRMHQIRVHSAHIGHPVIGDFMYGNPAVNRIANKKLAINRHLLHSFSYGFFDQFIHKKVSFQAEIPGTFLQLFK